MCVIFCFSSSDCHTYLGDIFNSVGETKVKKVTEVTFTMPAYDISPSAGDSKSLCNQKHTAEPWCNERLKDRQNLLAITRFRYMRFFSIHFTMYWGKIPFVIPRISLYRGSSM